MGSVKINLESKTIS